MKNFSDIYEKKVDVVQRREDGSPYVQDGEI